MNKDISTNFKEYYFDITEDYRDGPIVNYYEDNDSDSDSDNDSYDDMTYLNVNLEYSTENYTLFVIGDQYCNLHILYKKYFTTKEDAKKIALQAYCRVNGCTPFIVTGKSSSYKDQGKYGEPVEIDCEEIMNMDISSSFEERIFCVILDNRGSIVYTLSITPMQ